MIALVSGMTGQVENGGGPVAMVIGVLFLLPGLFTIVLFRQLT